MPVDEQILAKWVGGIGLSALIGWIASSLRIGRTIGKYEQRFKIVEETTATLKKDVADNKNDTTNLKSAINGIKCITIDDCHTQQAECHKVMKMQFDAQQAQFTAGTREFDEIKQMIRDSNTASERRHQESEKRVNILLSQLLSERGKTNVTDG